MPTRLPLDRLNPEVSAGLSDIIGRCLDADPRDRYPTAAALAGDLRRHLNHLPLVGVPNRSLIERWRKWRRRRPSGAAAPGVSGAVGGGRGHGGGTARGRLPPAGPRAGRGAREEPGLPGQRAVRPGGRHPEAWPGPGAGRARHSRTGGARLDEELRVVARDRKAAELHRLADLVRFRYRPGATTVRGSAHRCSTAVAKYGRPAACLLTPIPGRQAPELEHQNPDRPARHHHDLGRSSRPHWRRRPRRRTRAVKRSRGSTRRLRLSDRARRWNASASHTARPSGGPSSAAESAALRLEPRTAWEHCDLGRAYLRDGELRPRRPAVPAGRRPSAAATSGPTSTRGCAPYKLGRFEDALDAFRVCISLADNPAECYFNRALAYEALGRNDDAVADYTRALQCDDRLTGAALNRGILHYAAGRYADAAADLGRALATATGREARGVIHL